MFCALCQSEFHEGLTECSDCHVCQVETVAEHAIPSHYKELLHIAPEINICGHALGSTQPTFEYEVCVLRTDLENAKLAVQNIRGS